MLKINANKFLKFSTEYLWENLEGVFIISFDDGEFLTNEKEVIYSSYTWDYHRRYPNTPLLKKHHIRSVIGNDRISSKTHLKLIGNCLWSVYDTYKFNTVDRVKLLDDLARLAYEITNHMYNDMTYRLEEYVTSIDIIDFINVAKHPRILKAMNEVEPTQNSISYVYSEIKDVLFKDISLDNNPLIKATRSSIVDANQVMQCIGPRGFLTDIDSNQFKKPIMRGYVHGLRSLHDSAVESRSASKSLAFSTGTLEKSEYFSRRQQLICQNVKNLHMVDCGSTHYLLWKVRDAKPETAEDDIDQVFDVDAKENEYFNKTNQSDLATIAGKYYLDESSNTLKVIQKSDAHLIGQTIKIRSVVAGCMHPDPSGVCEVCFGETSLAIPAKTNLGHATCVSMTEKISQIVLSIKHLDGNAAVEGIVLKPYERKYLTTTFNSNLYYLNKDIRDKKPCIIINPEGAFGLTDINLVDDIESLNISRISEFKSITVSTSDNKGTDIITLGVSIGKRLANMTHDLLKHIKDNGWSVTDDGLYLIDMSGWDYSLPILSLPMRHFSMGDHMHEIAEMLEATVKDMKYRDSVVSPTAMLIEFHDLVNRRLSINLAILEIVIYSSMIVSASNNDYSLPKPWTDSGLGVMRLLLSNRSLAPSMAYERHKTAITSPSNYININRPDHIFDSLIANTF